ncbi:poly-beta-1,6-N-acetyl-D-glucosamine biosynthesis protein PgaD [Neobacillus sp. GCM10023253]|uniref:poly-beta-1,6-N-acetyl-D-glucosamine biosynthesis protein PgaD n=1 Tax=Neobacillus sp. GCM10023253 TaxID=3252644 RepID=UPI003616CA60
MIIHFNRSKARKCLDILLTILGWLFLLIFLYYFIIHFGSEFSLRFYWLSISNANAIVNFTILYSVLITLSLLWWSTYNKWKYGSLNRRTFPEPAHNHEIASYFQLTEEEIERVQNDKYVEVR